MGAIQNSINSVLGTATLVAGGAKKLKTDADALEASQLQETINLKGELPKLDEEIGKQEEAVTDAIADYSTTSQKYQPELDAIAKAEKKGFTKGLRGQQKAADAAVRGEEIGIELQKRETALKTAQAKLDAMKMQKQLYEKRLAKLTGGKK